MKKIISLAKKLKALADRGVAGEKENASEMLDRLMKQHGLTLDMIDGIEKMEHEFLIANSEYKFFKQVAASVLGEFTVLGYGIDRKKKKSRFITCTAAEAVEIHAKFDFYWRAWNADLDIFYKAFVQKNHLYQKPDGNSVEEEKELSREEMEKLWRMAQMMKGMDRHHFHKQLTQ